MYHGLICTCSHPPVFDVVSMIIANVHLFLIIFQCSVGDQGDGSAVVSVEGSDVLGNKRASYRDYVDLWKHLVDPTKLRVSKLKSFPV